MCLDFITRFVLLTILCNKYFVKCDTFPSLISTNATLAIVIDRDYVGEQYESIKLAIDEYLKYAKRELLRNGGVYVEEYTWTAINVKRDISAILSIAPCIETWHLFQAANSEHILHMAISESDCPRLPPNEAVTVPILKNGEELPQVLLDFRTAQIYKWKSALILYDSTLSRDLITRLISSLTAQYVHTEAASISQFTFKASDNTTQVRSELQEIFSTINTKTLGNNFLVIVSYELVEIVMECAKQNQLVNTKTQWLYIIADTNFRMHDVERFKKLLKEGDNIAFVYNTTGSYEECKDGTKCHSEEILEAFTRALSAAISEEIEMYEQVSDEEWEAIRPTKLERRNDLLNKVKSYLLKYGVCSNCTSWRMQTGETWGREYQQNTSNSNSEMIPVGSWRPIEGASMTDELFPHVSQGFRGKILPLVTFHNPPWQMIKTNKSGHVVEFSGLVFDIITELANNLNFTYVVHNIDPHFTYTSHHNQSNLTAINNTMDIIDITTYEIPTSIMDMILNKSVALGACGFTITEENKKHINFTIPISTETYTFLVARPRELSRALLFISPFTGDTWLCLSAAIISMGPILYYIHRFSPVYEYKGIAMKGGLSSIQNCIWYMYGALLQQGGMHLPYADSARLIVGAWWLVVLVVATTYCGNLVAFLTFPKIDIPITTIDDLLEHKDTVSWSFMKGSFLEAQLKTSPEMRFKEIYDRRIHVEKSNELIRNIESGKHVFIDWKIRLQYIMKKQYLETERCDLALGLDEFSDEQIAMIVSPDSPYLSRINEEIKKLHQVGLIQKWLKDYLPKKDRCWKNRHLIEVNNHTVNMDDMQGSFFVLLFGFLLSVFLIISEKLWHRHSLKMKKKIIQPFTK